MKEILAVCDRDEGYAQNLMRYISETHKYIFRSMAFSEEKSLCDYASENKIDVMLISENMLNEETKKIRADKRIIIRESREYKTLRDAGVYKYQAADKLLGEAMSLYDVENSYFKEKAGNRDGKSMIGVFSPVGGARKTTFALTLGQLLSKNNAVLYINLEGFSGLSHMLGMDFKSGLSDLLYYAKLKNNSFPVILQGMTVSIQNLDILPPAAFPEDIKDTPMNVWIDILDRIAGETKYEHIILDIGSEVADTAAILKYCSRVYVPVRRDEPSKSKIKEFTDYLRTEGVEEKKVRELILPFNTVSAPGRGYYENLIWSELGDYTRKLIKEEMKCGL